MKAQSSLKRVLTVATIACLLASAAPLAAAGKGNAAGPQIVPATEKYRGLTYSEWEAEWWQAMLQTPVDRMGRVVVEPDCTVPGRREVFVLGDAAGFRHDPRYEWLPGTAPVAMQQGRYAAAAISADLLGKARPLFRYADKGQLAVIGRGRGVAAIGPVRTAGFLAWFTWVFVHIFYLIGFANRVVVLFEWAIQYVTFSRGARLITHAWHPAGREAGAADGAKRG